MKTTTARTKRYFERLGYLVGHVEKWIQYDRGTAAKLKRPGFRRDLFGITDQVVIGFEPWATLYIQSCAGPSHAAHRTKILASENAMRLVNAGNGLALVSWKKKKNRWEPRIEFFGPAHFGQGDEDE